MYGKVYKSMFHGSMYGNPDGIITMMVLIALADREGYVDMTPQAIAATTSIPLGIIERGLEYLARTDPASRTPAEDGRRIVLIDEHRPWGWKIVNYQHYRDLRNEEARREQWRQSKRRERSGAAKSTKVNGASTRVNAVHNVHPSYLDADAEVSDKQKTKNTTAATRPAQCPEFEIFKSLYPRRAGSQPWPRALKSAKARIQEGSTWSEIHDGARRYAEFCRVTGKVGTEFVQQAATFLGPAKPFLEPWNPPATKADIRLASNLDAADEFMRRTENAAH